MGHHKLKGGEHDRIIKAYFKRKLLDRRDSISIGASRISLLHRIHT